MNNKTTIKQSEIKAIVSVCPYCMNTPSLNQRGCCGEYGHFCEAYDTGDELFLTDNVIIVEDTVWGEDSNFAASKDDVISAYSGDNKWTFKVVDLKPFAVELISGEELVDGCKPMFPSITFIDQNGNTCECALSDFCDKGFVFSLIV